MRSLLAALLLATGAAIPPLPNSRIPGPELPRFPGTPVPECALEWQPYLDIDDAHAVWFKDTATYDAFAGIGLGHSMKFYDQALLQPANQTMLDYLVPGGVMREGFCTTAIPGEDAHWRSQKVGPFQSRGGTDWWQLGWSDVCRVNQLLDQGAREGTRLGLTAHYSAPLDSAGAPLGIPPIHVHHIHIDPFKGGYEPGNVGSTCMLWGQHCADGSTVMQHHGDRQCTGQDGGVDCFADYYRENPKILYETPDLVAEFTDVRPFPSSPMTWWYQISIRVELVEGAAPTLSSHFTMNPGEYGFVTASDALCVTYVPTTVDSYLFYTGRMPFGGTLSFIEYHGHQKVLQKSLLFVATTQQLGLTSQRLRTPAHQVRITATTGLANNRALEEELMNALRSAQITAAPSDLVPEPLLACTAFASVEQTDGIWFDRKSRVECESSESWTFDGGDIFSVVQMSGPSTAPSEGAAFVGMGAVRDADLFSFPQHDNWIIWYVASDGDSHYSFAPYATRLDVTSSWGYDRIVTIRSMLHGGTPEFPVDPLERSKLAMAFLMVWLSGALTPAICVVLIGLFVVPLLAAWGFNRSIMRRVSSRPPTLFLATCLLVLVTVVIEVYLVALVFYVSLPRHVDINPHDTELFLATPLTEFEKANSGDVQLAISLFLVGSAAVAFVHVLNFLSPDSPGKKADGQSTLL